MLSVVGFLVYKQWEAGFLPGFLAGFLTRIFGSGRDFLQDFCRIFDGVGGIFSRIFAGFLMGWAGFLAGFLQDL